MVAACPADADADAAGAPAEAKAAAGAADELALPDDFPCFPRISKHWHLVIFGTAPDALDAVWGAVSPASGCEERALDAPSNDGAQPAPPWVLPSVGP
eukprot:3684023-Pyramimonas_sp.AAC.1